MERKFSQTHGDFYKTAQEKQVLDSEINQFRNQTEQELSFLEKEVGYMQEELQRAQMEL